MIYWIPLPIILTDHKNKLRRLGKFSSGATDTLLLVISGDKTAEQWHDDDDEYSRNPKCSEEKLIRVQHCPLQNRQEMHCISSRISAIRTWKLRVIYGAYLIPWKSLVLDLYEFWPLIMEQKIN